MSDKPWWLAGDTKPIVAWDSTSSWQFTGKQTILASGENDIFLFPMFFVLFTFELDNEQIIFVNWLISENKVISGTYETWEDFMKAHPQE